MNDGNNDDNSVTSLKDLNISDKKKIQNVIHGRKASTYLRIFRDDDGLTEDKQEQQDAMVPTTAMAAAAAAAAAAATAVPSHLKQVLSNSGVSKRKTSISLYDTHYKSSTVPRRKFSRSRNSSSGGIADPVVDSKCAASDQGNTLKPISSATYYPHKSDDPQGSEEVCENQSVPSLTEETSSSSNTHPSPSELAAINSEALETDDDYYDDDEEQDHEDYPLAVELQPFTNNVGGHTAIFRFSKRAVCKALVNRENKWYENIELRHKELLQFMPRYIGVLNVRQHLYNKDDIQKELPPPALSTNKAASTECEKDLGHFDPLKPGCPLTHIHSFPYDSNSIHSAALPEVVLDDNRHMISDSLLGIKPRSHSPSSLPTDTYLYSGEKSSSQDQDQDQAKIHQIVNINLGSTTVNTKLKALVLQEVFAPSHNAESNSGTNPNANPRKLMRKCRASSHDNSRRGSNQSLKNMATQPVTSPLLKKSLKESISHALNSPNSVMDLRQFHKKEMAREFTRNSEQEQSDKTESVANLGPNPNSNTGGNNNESTKSSPLLEPNESISPLTLPLDRANTNDEAIFEMDDYDVIKNRLPEPLMNRSDNSNKNNNNESVTFEEHSDTIVSKFILLEDLTRKLNRPCALDLKMGTRQYGVDAKRTKQLSQREKCLKTTSRRLGVRVCGLKVWNQSYYIVRDKYFGRRVKVGWQFTRVLARFIYNGSQISSIVRQIPRLIKQLDTLSTEIFKLKGYRLYGSSLLLMYDGNNPGNKRCRVKVNLIDFARCVTKDALDKGIDSFSIPPKNPQSEDRGFLRGLKSLKFYLMALWNHLTADSPLCNDEDELNQLLAENQSKLDKNWDWLDEFDNESEEQFNDPNSELRTKWRKYELIFDLEPRYNDDGEISD